MSATYIGNTGYFITETVYEEQKDGLATYTEKKLAPPTATTTTPSILSSIVINGQTLRTVSVNSVSSSGFRELTQTYQGQSGTRPLQQNASYGTGEEPIETNYNFLVGHDGAPSIVNLSGGTLTAGQSINATTGGAVFDADGRFLYFNRSAKAKLFGVTSYLNPNLTYRRSFTTTTTPSLTAVGRIVQTAGDFPTTVSGATWLCTSIQYVQRGTTFEVTQDFRSSDRKGWNQYIYGTTVSAPSTD